MIKVQIHDPQQATKNRPSMQNISNVEKPVSTPADNNSVQLMEVSTHGTLPGGQSYNTLKYKTQSLLFPTTVVRTTTGEWI